MSYVALSDSEKLVFAAVYSARLQHWMDKAASISAEINRLNALPQFEGYAMQTLKEPWVATPGSFPNYNNDRTAWAVTFALTEALGAVDQSRNGAYVLLDLIANSSGLEGQDTVIEDFFQIPSP